MRGDKKRRIKKAELEAKEAISKSIAAYEAAMEAVIKAENWDANKAREAVWAEAERAQEKAVDAGGFRDESLTNLEKCRGFPLAKIDFIKLGMSREEK